MLLAVVHDVVLAWGWRRRLYAFGAGAIGALALSPFDILPAMIVPMMMAVWLIDGSVSGALERKGWIGAIREAAGCGWWWGFGYFVAGLWWLGAAFLVEADQFAWALPLGVLGLPAVLAIFPALGFAIARLLWTAGPWRILALTVGLGASEWLRGHILTGFPWNEFGMALAGNLVTAQAASLVGLHGLTVVSIALFAAPETLLDRSLGSNGADASTWKPTAIAGGVLAMIAIYGVFRLTAASPGVVAGVKLRIMQPNLQQDEKFRTENRDAILRRYLTLSDRATSPTTSGIADATHVIWPESAFPFILSRDTAAVRQIAARLTSGAILITGAARVEETGDRNRPRYLNSIQVLTKDGLADVHYDKVHLVPFGEYLPLDWLLEKLRLRQFVHIPGGFTAGDNARQIVIPGLPMASPQVCYEAIFPDEIISPGARPKWLLNLTNDGWFGNTSGPYQHFSQARLRAIEQGLPLVRAANTGISGIVDAYGRVQASLPLGTEGVLDGALPQAINETIFSKASRLIPAALWFLGLLGAGLGRYRGRPAGQALH